jgi:hypothetical protein
LFIITDRFLLCFTTVFVFAQLTGADSQQISAKVAFRGSRHVKPVEKGCQDEDDKDEFPIPPSSLPNLVEKARVGNLNVF